MPTPGASAPQGGYARGVEIGLALLVVAAAALSALALSRRAWLAGAIAAAGTIAALTRPAPRAPPQPPMTRERPDALGYAGSAECKACHEREHASWARTFHRSMTRAPAGDAIEAPCAALPANLGIDGVRVQLSCDGGAMRATLGAATRDVRLVTGSHHYQVFWVDGARPGELDALPFVWLREEGRWAPRRDVFLAPPGPELFRVSWGGNCAQCHATSPRPGRDRGAERFETDAAELGIACEACHGPGADHAKKMKSPLARARARTERSEATGVVDPRSLSAERASMICGQCHSVAYPRDEDEWWARGYSRRYRPGEDLRDARILITREVLGAPGAPTLEAPPDSLFFRDGALRVTGRELHDTLASACHEKGEGARRLSCLSCHAMHDGSPDRQLAPERGEDGACASCHDARRYAHAEHTHHAGGAVRCVDCHMPRTTYGLLRAIRAHRIDAPRARAAGPGERPDACSLCHVERSAAWTARAIAGLWGATPGDAALAEVSSVASAALRGDAGQRAIAAAALGRLPGRERRAADAWREGVLARLLEDPYAAVRSVARASLVSLGVEEARGFDPSGPPEERASRARAVRAAVGARAGPMPLEVALPRDARGAIDDATLDQWYASRDATPVFLAE